MWLVYVLLVLLLLGLVVAAFLARRKRIVEEERRLREAQEVEIPGGPGGRLLGVKRGGIYNLLKGIVSSEWAGLEVLNPLYIGVLFIHGSVGKHF